MKCLRCAMLAAGMLLGAGAGGLGAAQAAEPAASAPAGFDEALARRVGADELGMRSYVLVVLRTGPHKVPAGPERDAMFRGHFDNMKRLSAAGQLVLAGPFDGVDGWRGLFVFAVKDIEEAKRLVATDPVVIHGEMVPEFHAYYGSAALMLVPELHDKVARKRF